MDESEEAGPAPPLMVGAHAVELSTPRSYAARYDVLACSNLHRACAAALALCWGRLTRQLRSKGIAYQGDALAFGGVVIDHLSESGVPLGQIYKAGTAALNLCGRDLPRLEVAEEMVGNSEAGAG